MNDEKGNICNESDETKAENRGEDFYNRAWKFILYAVLELFTSVLFKNRCFIFKSPNVFFTELENVGLELGVVVRSALERTSLPPHMREAAWRHFCKGVERWK